MIYSDNSLYLLAFFICAGRAVCGDFEIHTKDV